MTEKVLLSDLATYLKEIAPDVWAIFLRQQYYWGVAWIVALIFSCGLLAWGAFLFKRRPEWAVDSMNDNMGGIIVSVVGGLSVFACCMGLLIDGIPRLFNPAYFVIKALIP